MDPSQSSTARYQPAPTDDVSAVASPGIFARQQQHHHDRFIASSTSSASSHSSAAPISSRRRHSIPKTDDGINEDDHDIEGKRQNWEHEDDEDAEALELDTFLPRSADGNGRARRNGGANLDEDGHAKSPGAIDGLDPDDPLTLVKRAVPETDDPSLPALTLRVVVIGSFFAVLGAAVAQLFFYKSNSPGFSSYFVILVSLPVGRWLARRVPNRTVYIPLVGGVELNPGDFSIKEHLLIAVIASSGAHSAYASDILNIQILFFHTRMTTIPSILLLLSTQCLGFGMAGLVHNLLIKAPSMIFPSTLVTTSLFHTLHAQESVESKRRLRFFIMAFLVVFAYQFGPALMAPTLSSVALLCMFDNRSSILRILGSGYKGLGFLNVSLDWTAVGATGPLFQPWWAAVNYYTGFAGMMWLVMPILYWGVNLWDAQSFPSVLGSALFTNTKPRGKFDVAAVLGSDNTLDQAKWQQAKPMLLTPYFAISYGIGFAILTSLLTHIMLWHWKDVKRALTNQLDEDYHNKAMRNYEAVPRMWYLLTLGLSLVAAIMLALFAPIQLPVWGLLIAISISLIFLVPVGLLKATSDTSVGLNIITEFVAGYVLPGKPIANVVFKTYGYMSMSQALDLAVDMKLALYMKIPPKHMFVSQLLGTVIGCIVNYLVLSFVLSPTSGYIPYISGEIVDPTGQWDGRKAHIFYSASIIWGAIGPAEFFSGEYRTLYWGFILGAILPLPFYFAHNAFHKRLAPYGINLSKVAFPIFLHGANAAPQVPTNIIFSGFLASFLSQKWAREKRPKWFARYNYPLSAALDAASSINALVVFVLSVTLLKLAPMPRWFLNPKLDAEHCTPS